MRKNAILFAATWLVVAAIIFGSFSRYENTAAPLSGKLTDQWPARSHLHRSKTLPTLIMTLHPKCSCSEASLTNLSRAMPRLHQKMFIDLVFSVPSNHIEWGNNIAERSLAIPGAVSVVDIDGKEAQLFGAQTSGETFLYSPDGTLIYHGGITAGRGHEGDNPGLDAITELVLETKAARSTSPVFGCALKAGGDNNVETARVDVP